MRCILLSVVLLAFAYSNAQEKFEIPQLGFSITSPQGWTCEPNNEIDWQKSTIAKFETLFKNSKALMSCYDLNKDTLTKPTVNISLKYKPLSTKGDLVGYSFTLKSDFEKLLLNYKCMSINDTKIEGKDAFIMVANYDIIDKKGHVVNVHSKSLFIKAGNFLILLYVVDTDYEAMSQIFTNVKKSIKIAK